MHAATMFYSFTEATVEETDGGGGAGGRVMAAAATPKVVPVEAG